MGRLGFTEIAVLGGLLVAPVLASSAVMVVPLVAVLVVGAMTR